MNEQNRTIPEERAWRDIRLSQWRKKLGWDIAANDIDMLLIEYCRSVPVALIEYKLEHATFRDEQLAATQWLADAAKLPFFVVVYGEDMDWFQVCPTNAVAKLVIGDEATKLTERGFVELLYRLRKQDAPAEELAKLSDALPKSKLTAERIAENDRWIDQMFGKGDSDEA